MRRFGTKNLAEGWDDVYKLGTYRDEFEIILTPDQPVTVINSTIDSMIEDMGGPKEAAALMYGAMESVDTIKGLLKRLIPDNAKPLNVSKLTNIVNRLPFDPATKKQLNINVMQLAQDLGLKAV